MQQTGLKIPKRLMAAAQRRAGMEMMLDELFRPTAAWFGDDLTSKRDQMVRASFARDVNKTRQSLGDRPHSWSLGKLQHVLELADWDRGTANSVPGQSGQPGSPHYADFVPLWDKGRYFPLALSREKIEEVTRHRLSLTPVN